MFDFSDFTPLSGLTFPLRSSKYKLMSIAGKEKTFRPSHGEKAFLYQQAAELNAPVVILTGKNLRDKNGAYSVTFVVDPVRINMKIKETGQTLFQACMKAKASAKKQLSQLAGLSAPDRERNLVVELIKSNFHIH